MFQFQSPYSNLAALAEARAAEAAAKAAEAEYLALEARARAAEQQSNYWAQSAPAYYSSHYPAPHGYPGYVPPPRAPFDNFPGFPHQYFGAPPAPQPSFAERELEARLRQEQLARLQAERKLKLKELELEERERRLSQPVFVDFHARAKRPEPPRHKAHGHLFPKHFGGYPHQVETQRRAPSGESETEAPGHDYAKFFPFIFAPSELGETKRTAAHIKKPEAPKPSTEDTNDIERMILHALFGSHAEATGKPEAQQALEKVEEAPKATQSPVPTKKAASEGSLIDQLKARYEKEGEREVRDTIQAIINSLSEGSSSDDHIDPVAISSLSNNPSRHGPSYSQDLANSIWATINALSAPHKPAFQHIPTASSSSPSSSSSSSAKGKEPASPTEPISRDVVNALERVDGIEDAFKRVEADFVFPSELDFISPSNPSVESGDAPHMAFTARNHPVRYYEQTLSSLLTQLDQIESYGNQNLRLKRKDAVDSIEQALEELEEVIVARWRAKVAAEQAKQESVEKVAAPLEETVHAEEASVSEPVLIPNEPTEEESADLLETIRPEEHVLPSSVPVAEKQDGVDEPESVIIQPTEESASIVESTQSNTDQVEENVAHEVAPEISESLTAVDQVTPAVLVEGGSRTSTQELAGELEGDADREDTFLLAEHDSFGLKAKTQRKSVSVEDLGSDWSDLDA